MAHPSAGGQLSRAAFADIARHVAGGESSYARLRAGAVAVGVGSSPATAADVGATVRALVSAVRP